MKTLSFLILSLFAMNICINLSTKKSTPVKSSGTSRKNCCPFATKKKAVVYYSVDNVANYYSINGVATHLTSADNSDWTITKVANIMLAPGDVFCLNGNNVPGGNENSNPAAMIASIRYYDYNGKLAWLNTSSNWLCDGIKAKQFNTNSDTSSIWYGVKGSFMTNIRPNAWWIWNTAPWSPNSYSTCCVTIPCCLKKSSYYFDDYYDC